LHSLTLLVQSGSIATTSTYDGGRVQKIADGTPTVYIGELYECTASGCSLYIFAGDTRLAMRDNAGALHYYHTDHLGSSTVITDEAGELEQV
jgi:hypothetical protein